MAKPRVINLKPETDNLIIKLPNGDIIDIVLNDFGGYWVDHREGVNSDSFASMVVHDAGISDGN